MPPARIVDIDPANPSEEDNAYLSQLFQAPQYKDEVRFKKYNRNVEPSKQSTYVIQYKNSTTNVTDEVEIRLTNSIKRTLSKISKNGFSYHVQQENQSVHAGKKQIGKGGFAKVNLILGSYKFNQDNQLIYKPEPKAIKQMLVRTGIRDFNERRKEAINAAQFDYEAKLSKVLSHLKSKPVINYIDKNRHTKKAIVMALIEGDNLRNILHADCSGYKKITLKERFELTIALLEAYKKQIHDTVLIHRDIKPENIMVAFKNGRAIVKFIDVGLSKFVYDKEGIVGGTPGYSPPEMLKDGVTNNKSDIFSMGIVLSELWGAEKKDDSFVKLFKGIDGLNSTEKSKMLKQLLQMISYNQEDRPEIEDTIEAFKALSQLNVIKGELEELQNQYSQKLIENQSVQLYQFKVNLLTAIKSYIDPPPSPSFLQRWLDTSEPASPKRVKNVREILDIIQTGTAINIIMVTLKDYMNNMQKGRTSLLCDKITKVLETEVAKPKPSG